MNLPEKAKALIHYLEEKIVAGHFVENSKIPSIRELMEQFNLTYGTVKRGVDYLCETGLVEVRPKSGVFVKKRERQVNGACKVSLIFSNSTYSMTKGIYSTIFLGIQKAAEANGCSLMMDFLPVADASAGAITAKTKGADGIILMAEYDRMIHDLTCTVPGVGVCMNESFGGKLSLVDIDPFDIAQKTTEFFKSKGCQKVIIVDDENRAPAYSVRGQLFAANWTSQGIEYSTECHTYAEEFQIDKNTGVFFTTGSVAQYFIELHKKRTGQELDCNIPMLSIDGKNLLEPSFYPVNTIALNWQMAGKYVLEECLYRINNPGSIPKRIYLPGVINEVS